MRSRRNGVRRNKAEESRQFAKSASWWSSALTKAAFVVPYGHIRIRLKVHSNKDTGICDRLPYKLITSFILMVIKWDRYKSGVPGTIYFGTARCDAP
eukprot:2043129-Rhodomonas_salina.1